jgi:hypothetical protein
MKSIPFFFLIILIVAGFMQSCEDKPKRRQNQKASNQDTSAISLKEKPKIVHRYGTKPIELFIEKFYTSLELSPELSRKNYLKGGVKFPLDSFNSCITKNSIYSKDRISILTGPYHDRVHIELIQIDSVKEAKGILEVYTHVMYGIYETGSFENLEKLIIRKTNDKFAVERWEDYKLKKMHMPNAESYGLQNFTERDFYKIVGSINKK